MKLYEHIKNCIKTLEDEKILNEKSPAEIQSFFIQFASLITLAKLCDQITKKQETYLRKKISEIHFASLVAVSGTI